MGANSGANSGAIPEGTVPDYAQAPEFPMIFIRIHDLSVQMKLRVRNIENFNSSVVSSPFFLIFEKWTANDQKNSGSVQYPVLNINTPYHAKV
eukprot:COSAG02_NODE_3841_length_6167_cov_50.360997_2_plen_93_part_00